MPAITLATTLERLRKSAGLSYDQLSSRSLVDRRYLWDLDSGKKATPAEISYCALASGCGLKWMNLMSYSERPAICPSYRRTTMMATHRHRLTGGPIAILHFECKFTRIILSVYAELEYGRQR